MIDLRSDTVTQPCNNMRKVMANAPVGDDVYGEDPSVNALEVTAAGMLGKEAAMFVPSGTQSNLLALLTHCGRGDEYIVGQSAHTYRLEGGGAAALGGIQPQPLPLTTNGLLDLEDVERNVKPDDFHFARSTLLCLENTHAGHALPYRYIEQARQLCDRKNLSLHLDGARFFNAAIAERLSPETLAAPFDTVSICLSKGLGAPVGSVLLGPAEFIRQARRWRKMVGGGMRQAGIIAAAGLYALENNIVRLEQDHQHASQLGETLREKFGENEVACATNMIHLSLPGDVYTRLQQHLKAQDIRVGRPRWVMHLDIDDAALEQIKQAVETF